MLQPESAAPRLRADTDTDAAPAALEARNIASAAADGHSGEAGWLPRLRDPSLRRQRAVRLAARLHYRPPMRSRAHIDGHPIHPMLVPFPFAYLFGAACLDTAASVADRPRWYRTARHMRTLGIGAALLAAVPGIVDYLFAVPPDSSAGRRATWHGAANLSAVALMSTVAATRRDGTRPTSWELSAQALAAGLMGFAGYLGGTLVYRNQIGVDHRYAAAGQWQERTLRPPRDGQAIDAGAAADLAPNQMALVHVGERRVVIARTEDRVVAFDDHCPHKGGPLSDGTLACGVVQCPWHGSQFDVRTGRVVQGPADTPVAVHRVEEKDGRLWLRLAD